MERTKEILKPVIVCSEHRADAFDSVKEAVNDYIMNQSIILDDEYANYKEITVSIGSAVDKDGKRWYAIADADIFVNVNLQYLLDVDFWDFWDVALDDKVVWKKVILHLGWGEKIEKLPGESDLDAILRLSENGFERI